MHYGMGLLATLLYLFLPTTASASQSLDWAAAIVAHRTDASYYELVAEWNDVPEEAQEAITRAVFQLDKEYVFASDNPDVGFDCSGLMAFAYEEYENIPNTSRDQIRYAEEVEDPAPGDLVYYPGHVMMYLGTEHDLIIHAANRRVDVTLGDLPDRHLRFGRIVEHEPPVGTIRAF